MCTTSSCLFLNTVITLKNTSSNVEEEPVNEVSDDTGEVPAVSAEPWLDNKNKKRKVEQVSRDVEEILGVLKSSIQSREDRVNALENDCDHLFLLLLLKPLKEVPECMRFSVKMQIMQVIENARKKATSSTAGPSNVTPNFTCDQRTHHHELHHQQQQYTLTPLTTAAHQMRSTSVQSLSTGSDSSAEFGMIEFRNVY